LSTGFVDTLRSAWIPNQGGGCTTAAVLAGLGALGARNLPELGDATMLLGASAPYGAPALLDYVRLPRRRAPLDLKIEQLGRAHGLEVRSRSSVVLPGWPLRPPLDGVLVVHLAWGQEAPGRYGTWGWNPLRPATYNTGGHSVVLAETHGQEWLVVDPNHPEPQLWPRPGLATARTLLSVRPRPPSGRGSRAPRPRSPGR
jgi:hypothetical protein